MNKRCIYCQRISDVGENDIDCPACGLGNKLTPFVHAPMHNATTFRVFDAYESPASGKLITNHQARRRDMAETNSREWEGMEQEKKYAAKAREDSQKQFDDNVGKWVSETYHALPYEKKQALENVAP